MDTFLKALLLVSSGILLLRISGRKSISQMTVAQTVVMISIGSLMIQPIVDKSLWRTLLAASHFYSNTNRNRGATNKIQLSSKVLFWKYKNCYR